MRDYQDYETVSLVVLAVAFEIAERVRPARPIDRRAELRLDLAALLVLLVAVNSSRLGIAAGARALRLDAAAGGVLDWLRALPGAAKIALGLVFMDFVIYWIHRGMHKFDFLWKTHKWHHSAENLYWFSGFRTSFFHVLLFAIPQVIVPFFIFRVTPLEAGIGFSIGVFFQLWQHANVDVNLGPLGWFIVTPGYHRIHHSATRWQDQNLGIILTIWDRMFGTYVDPKTVPPDYRLGLRQKISKLRMMIGV